MMIPKVTLNISFANIGKLFCLELILQEAKSVINLYIDRLGEVLLREICRVQSKDVAFCSDATMFGETGFGDREVAEKAEEEDQACISES